MKRRVEGKKGFIIIGILILLIVGYYYYLSNRQTQPQEEVTVSKVQDLLLRDLERNYPPSPKEVVKYYFEITKCLYTEKLSNEDVDALAFKLEEIFDEELRAYQIKEEYLLNLKSEIAAFQESKSLILNYSTSSSTDVDYFTEDGYEFARLYGTFYLQVQKNLRSLENVFLLRKDENGHWKIYGWEQVEEQETQEIPE